MAVRRFCLLVLVALLGFVLSPYGAVLAQGGSNDAAAQKALAYIRTQQQPDGTFKGFGAGSTADAIYALVAAGAKPGEVKNGQASALDGLAKLAPEAAKPDQTGLAAKFAIAALLAGQNPRSVGGNDLVAAVEKGFNQGTGQYGKDVTSHALALIALRGAGATVQPAAVQALEKLQLPDGGWSFDGAPATGSDTNTTSVAVQALVATGGSDQARQKALSYLKAQQNADGGFPFSQTSQYGNASDANSTALAVEAIVASGDSLNNWAKGGKTPLDRLLAFQNPSGAFRFQDTPPDDNAGATYQAVPAVKATTFPLRALASGTNAPHQLPNTGGRSAPYGAMLAGVIMLIAAGRMTRRRV
jgi:LPXTG-motif cell wall-anchored protein